MVLPNLTMYTSGSGREAGNIFLARRDPMDTNVVISTKM